MHWEQVTSPTEGKKIQESWDRTLGDEDRSQLKMVPGSMNQKMNVQLKGEEEKSYGRTVKRSVVTSSSE